MKVTILYFSQTGNTLKVARAMDEAFSTAGCNTTCLSIKEARPEDFIHSDIIGIGTPAFESHAPTPMKDFVRTLPMLSGKRSFVFATCGGASGDVLSDLAKLLKRKGCEIIDSFLTIGEVHHPAPCIVGISQGRPNEEDLNNARRFALTIIGRKGSTSEMQHNGLKTRKGFYNLVGKIAGSDTLVRLLEPRPKIDQNKCKRCEVCVHECPMNNIAMNPGPVVNQDCIRCYRCANICKNKAFSANWWLGNLVVFLLWNKFFMHWFGEYNREK